MRIYLSSCVAIALWLTSAPSFAGSAETDAFVSNVRLEATFLARSSDLAADRSENTDLRRFASGEATSQDAVVADLGLRLTPQVAQHVPVIVASEGVITGRSAAIDTARPSSSYTAPQGVGALMPAALITLDHLAASKGHAFDALYEATQNAALRQLAALYDVYSMTGDDAVLRQLAKTELATINGRIADIARF